MNITLKITDNENPDFRRLVKDLDKDLYERYGEAQQHYDQFNQLTGIQCVALVYNENIAIACGAFKPFDKHTVEMKRIYVTWAYRQHGLATQLLKALEEEAIKAGYEEAILETGIRQHEAIGLYEKYGYRVVENFGQYVGDPNSVCMRKILKRKD